MAKRKANKHTTLTQEQQETYFRAVERVNKQMQRLEKYQAKHGGKITQYAYKVLQADIKQFFGPGKKRFSRTDIPRDMRSYLARMNAIEAFYKMPTATITGHKEIFDKRAVSLSMKIGKDISGDQLRKVFETGLFDQLMEHYGSETSLQAIKEIDENKDDLLEQINSGDKIVYKSEILQRLNTEIKGMEEFNDVLANYLKG